MPNIQVQIASHLLVPFLTCLLAHQVKIDFHESTGHIRFTQTGSQADSPLSLRVISQSNGPSSSTAIPDAEKLSLSTKSCLSALKRYFKSERTRESSKTPSPPPDYQVSIAQTQTEAFLPSEPLRMASTTTKEWVVARVPDFAPGTPSTGFTVASRFSQSILESLLSAALQTSGSSVSSSQSSANGSVSSKSPAPSSQKPRTGPLSMSNASPVLRTRLHGAFTALATRMQATNPEIPVAPSSWRRDQRALQQELDQWLCDVVQLDPTHPALIAFLTDEDDGFIAAPLGSSASGYFSLAFSSVMEAKPYRSLFTPSTAPKPMVLLFGATQTGKSAFINQIVGFPTCDPAGALAPSAGVGATVYEVLSPAAFAKIAALSSYWTHSLQFNLSSYPPGSEVLVVAPEKLQEPIHRLDTSWKRGGAFILLDHDTTLTRYKFAPNLGHITCRTCLINEAALDPVRLEYDIARNNVFVEFNNVEHMTDDFGEMDIADAKPLDNSGASEPESLEAREKKTRVGGLVNATSSLPLHLLEIAHFLTKSTRILHFGSFSTLPRVVKDGWMLEIAELLSANRDTFLFSETLAKWIQSATPTTKKQLDLLKLLSLMSPWLNMLSTPRKQRHIIFMTPLTAQEYLDADETLDRMAPEFRVHNIFASTARVLATRDLTGASSKVDGGANLVVSVNQSTPLSTSAAYSFAAAFDFLLPTEARDSLFQQALAPRPKM